MITVGAPGKLFLAGEYAVLEGGTAVVAAVDRRAVAKFVAGAAPATPLVAECLRAARRHAERRGRTLPEGAPRIDTSALTDGTAKLGLGSSAAAAAAAVGVSLAIAGEDLEGGRATIFELALGAHRAVQGGRGSGGDVAVSVFGGVVAYRLSDGGAPDVRALAPRPPVEVVVFRAGGPSSTVDHLRAVERLAERDAAAHERCLREISGAAAAFVAAYEAADASGLIAAVERSHRALDALGRAADLPIVTGALARAAELARACGGAAKPSGAGGGDVGLAFFADPEAAGAFRAGAAELDLPIVHVQIGARGLARGE